MIEITEQILQQTRKRFFELTGIELRMLTDHQAEELLALLPLALVYVHTEYNVIIVPEYSDE